MSITLHRTHNYLKLQQSNFDIVNFQDLDKFESEEILTKNHKVDFYALIFITEGKGKHSIDFSDYEYDKGLFWLLEKIKCIGFI